MSAGGFDQPGPAYPKKDFNKGEVELNVQQLYDKQQNRYDTAGGFYPSDEPALPLPYEEVVFHSPDDDNPICIECKKQFIYSNYHTFFGYPLCNECKAASKKDIYGMITRTDAKKQFSLKDEDLDYRKPSLRFIKKKNVNRPRGADMKLYLKAQIVERCNEIHGSIQNMELKKAERQQRGEDLKIKRFERKLREHRIEEAPVLKKPMYEVHVHNFLNILPQSGSNRYYIKRCISCGLEATFEN